MDYLPLFTKLTDRPCIVVGGGDIATRKITLLMKAGASITVISPQLCDQLQELADNNAISVLLRDFQAGDLAGSVLVIAATDDETTNRTVAAEAMAYNIPINAVDNPAISSVIMPAIIDRSPVVVAISSGGDSPVLTRRLRAKLETQLPSRLGELAKLAGRFRDKVKQRFATVNERRLFWEDVLEGPASEQMLAGQEDAAARIIEDTLASDDGKSSVGEVYLVGAGPGDPDLLTFRALRLMQKADIVLYDRLVSDEILDMVRRDADRIYVGKARADHALPQEEINEFLLNEAQKGKRVLRLKGGDPFVFGRGGEEIMRLAEEGIPFQVVPGVTAASGCASYAGIPLTHRDHAQSCVFVTGHTKDGKLDLNWQHLAQTQQTNVFYMGLANVKILCDQLQAHGLDADTPAAVIQNGTRPNQTVLVSSVGKLAEDAKDLSIKLPSLIFVGHTVSLREKLAWF
jgi:uroporphyrin-III C-methyltransferase/precorrin-2 dehydrogenase/sirohydrochlorin ferrochelatase